METRRVTLWCRLLDKSVAVTMLRNPRATPMPAIPEGWEAESCSGKDTECFKTGCPFTVEEDVQGDVSWPFGESGGRC